jgi:hypothetical protein
MYAVKEMYMAFLKEFDSLILLKIGLGIHFRNEYRKKDEEQLRPSIKLIHLLTLTSLVFPSISFQSTKGTCALGTFSFSGDPN